jgi:hypothetical protein
MAKRFTIEILMDLAKSIGANPQKFVGTKTNITFLGAGPQKNPLFQRPVPGLEEHITSMTLQGQRGAALDKSMISAVEDAMGFATAGKLNDIQLKALTINLQSLNKGLNPPMATISKFPKRGSGITTVEGVDPRETILPMQRSTFKSVLPEPGPGDIAAFRGALDMQTGMSRAIARNLLLKDTRLKLSPEDLMMLKEGKGEPLDMMAKYYGESMSAYDDFLNSVNLEAARPDEFAEMILKNIKLIPAFAGGGLAKILEVNDQVNRYDLM